jgi:hypothetical protein
LLVSLVHEPAGETKPLRSSSARPISSAVQRVAWVALPRRRISPGRTRLSESARYSEIKSHYATCCRRFVGGLRPARLGCSGDGALLGLFGRPCSCRQRRIFAVSVADSARQLAAAIIAPGQYTRKQNERADNRVQDNNLTNRHRGSPFKASLPERSTAGAQDAFDLRQRPPAFFSAAGDRASCAVAILAGSGYKRRLRN